VSRPSNEVCLLASLVVWEASLEVRSSQANIMPSWPANPLLAAGCLLQDFDGLPKPPRAVILHNILRHLPMARDQTANTSTISFTCRHPPHPSISTKWKLFGWIRLDMPVAPATSRWASQLENRARTDNVASNTELSSCSTRPARRNVSPFSFICWGSPRHIKSFELKFSLGISFWSYAQRRGTSGSKFAGSELEFAQSQPTGVFFIPTSG
jgi:hypothetical protein